jgi:hypothetical protein
MRQGLFVVDEADGPEFLGSQSFAPGPHVFQLARYISQDQRCSIVWLSTLLISNAVAEGWPHFADDGSGWIQRQSMQRFGGAMGLS